MKTSSSPKSYSAARLSVAISALSISAAALHAVPLPVINAGFEGTVNQGFTYEGTTYVTGDPVPDHTFTDNFGANRFLGDSASGASTGGTADIFPWTASPGGGIVFDSRDYLPGQGPTQEGAYLSLGPATPILGLFQTLVGTTFAANTTYTLSAQLSDRRFGGPPADNVTFPATIQLSLAGSFELDQGTLVFTPPAPGSSSIATYTVQTDANPPTGDVTIIFRASGYTGEAASQAVFDNVTLDAVPEPASAGLLCLGALGLLAQRRRAAR